MSSWKEIEAEETPLDRRVERVRRFTRFYLRVIGLLNERVHRSPFTLAESRIVRELARSPDATASDLVRGLELDAGYVSRVLRGMRRNGLVRTRRSPQDRRRSLLRLTAAGHGAFAHLDRVASEEIASLLEPLTVEQQEHFVGALDRARELLDDARAVAPAAPYVLRPHGPGDMGWIVQVHAALYADAMGWGAPFEALIADIVSRFLRNFDPERERCWIAERDGQRVGCVLVVRAESGEKDVAQLRCLLVDPSARGLGIGRRLVEECVRFARGTGYRRMVLFTDPDLARARRIYEAQGFELTGEEPHHLFGGTRVGQRWELTL